MIKKVERYKHYLRHPGGLIKFFIKLVFLSIFLCFILSACNPEATVSENGQSIDEDIIIEENSLISNTEDSKDDTVQENTDDSISDDNSNGGDDSSTNQGTGNGNSSSPSNEGGTDTEKINAENSQQDTGDTLMEKPSVKLSIIEGPGYAQDDSICFYRVKAEVTGNPTPVIIFSKDDSIGAWGSNVTQINLAQNEAYDLICEANNSEGTSTASITLKWITAENMDTSSQSAAGQENQEASIDYSNPGNFRIDVNLTAQVVSVYYNENLIRSMKCSGGTADNPTVTGTFSTYENIYRAWIAKFNQGAYYWVRFYGPYLFHSVPFDQNWNMIAEEASKIGTPASHGCIRMALEDAKWFYETLPLGIKVDIHY